MEAVHKFVEYHYSGTSNAWVKQEITPMIKATRTFKVPDYIYTVKEVLGIDNRYFTSNGFGDGDGFSRAGFAFNTAFHTNTMDYLSVYMVDVSMSYFKNILSPPEVFNFNKITREISIDVGNDAMQVGDFIMYRASIDLSEISGNELLWSNDWLIRYTEALIQEQYGVNTTKYKEVQLPGGHVMNGDEILSDAKDKKEKLIEELYTNYYSPVPIIIG